MNIYKHVFYKFVVLSLSSIFSIQSLHAQQTGTPKRNDLQEVLAAAQAGLQSYLQRIPEGREVLYGFENRDQFALAQLGTPYQMAMLSDRFLEDSNSPDSDFIIPTGDYRVPIVVNDEYKALLTVSLMNGTWQVTGIGAKGLARDLQEFEESKGSDIEVGMLVRVMQLSGDFVFLVNPSGETTAYPLASAQKSLGDQRANDSDYSASELLQMLRTTLKRK